MGSFAARKRKLGEKCSSKVIESVPARTWIPKVDGSFLVSLEHSVKQVKDIVEKVKETIHWGHFIKHLMGISSYLQRLLQI